MNEYIRLQIGSLYLAFPRSEMAQINLAKDIRVEQGIACVEFQANLIPVVQLDQDLRLVQAGNSNLRAQYVVTLATLDEDLTLKARLALQVDSTLKIRLASSGPIPSLMKQQHNPLINWFEDSFRNRGFITNTDAVETFINHLAQVTANERYSAMAS